MLCLRVLQDNILPPLTRFSGQRPSHEAKAEALRNRLTSVPISVKDDLRGGCPNPWDVGEIDACNAVKLTTKIQARIVALPMIGRSLGAWWHRILLYHPCP
jgi:hypothetical protein